MEYAIQIKTFKKKKKRGSAHIQNGSQKGQKTR